MQKLLTFSLIFLLSGCTMWDQFKESTGITPETSSIELIITADKVLNVREGGQSSPVILRIHELNSPVLFRNLDFFALFENDKDALGDEYIKRYEYQIQPGDVVHETLVLDPATRAIGFSVAFRDINGSSWRKVELIEEKSEYFLKLNLKESELSSNNTRGIEQIYF
ncbi:type VI secretion system lipoprotein TssJ [Aliivibrio fischeri]|uniref:Type VI secretion system lipoprotein TssJ n=1 Tax=Aliivibrio fischeri TaxID=668 RepID=A0A6N3Z3M5_ALIFS|nr:type VI secretion system lipoprotein TssJ [Aliivibrio fischeri]MUK37780.1 type VI secretion system lipoprotein TssJ [Aliivibrio fischeri]MUK45160.1 type VI secretion system lipoprotein TssJ [Aliivibrio fischeri]MUK80819.1 type VI secretion system lipoprotein TssJ [Aliivibrio fischeri]MUK84172.1 type VI secretion system lipoprotein TssJ [Aliivibrio fischeri]MUL06566.1 type VI secretion system lipoprotein TssJ [Aliivibrio fischeri]